MNNLCECAACQLRRKRQEQGLEEAVTLELTDEEKQEIKDNLLKILDEETVKSREVCGNCSKEKPIHISLCLDWAGVAY